MNQKNDIQSPPFLSRVNLHANLNLLHRKREEKRGRPSKTYEDSSVSTKKRKNKDLLDTCGLDFILNSYTQGLRARGEREEALIVEVLRTLPPEKKSEIRNTLLSEPAHLTAYTKNEALGIFIDLNQSKAQYENMRSYLITKNCLLFPSYKSIREAKRMCYPPDSSIEITNIKAKIKLQDLLDHTSARLIKIDDVYKQGLNHLNLYSKWGCDGSSGQSEYKQPLPEEMRFCRPILIEFSKETPEKTTLVVNDINAQILALNPSLINHNGEGIEIKHTLFLTMIDGKVAQVLSETSSSAVCTICGAKPTEMNNLEKVRNKPVDEVSYQYGLSTLHCWIRFMEPILHLSYNLGFEKWSATTTENKDLKKHKKAYVQRNFREELGLNIDKPKQVDEELLKRFYVILQVMSCGRGIDATKFGQYAFDTAQLYVNKYKWFYMPSSVHKVLIHGESVIRHFSVLPLGQLSEDAQES
ncbi:hypothetical protein ACJJTC_017484 [Scirpophaga incertulas]